MKGYYRERKNKWSFTIDAGRNTDGSRKQISRGGFDSKNDAEDAAVLLKAELLKDEYIDESKLTFSDFADQWLIIYEQTHNVKPSSVRVRKHEAGKLKKCFAHRKLKEVTRKMYQDALTSLKKAGLADNTLSGIHSTGRMIFTKAVEYDLIKSNPTQFAKLPRTRLTVEQLENQTELPKYLEKEDLAKFLAEAKASRYVLDYPIFITLAYTGMRIGELAALKWTDIDERNRTVSVTKTLYNPTNNALKYELLTPKTKRSRRVIDVDRVVIDALDKWRARQKEVKMEHRQTYHDKEFVFTKMDIHPGYPEHLKTFGTRMRLLLSQAGLNDKLTPHSLRHTHASLLAEANVGLEEIMNRLGHADDATTRLIYLHITKDKKKEAATKFSNLMNGL